MSIQAGQPIFCSLNHGIGLHFSGRVRFNSNIGLQAFRITVAEPILFHSEVEGQDTSIRQREPGAASSCARRVNAKRALPVPPGKRNGNSFAGSAGRIIKQDCYWSTRKRNLWPTESLDVDLVRLTVLIERYHRDSVLVVHPLLPTSPIFEESDRAVAKQRAKAGQRRPHIASTVSSQIHYPSAWMSVGRAQNQCSQCGRPMVQEGLVFCHIGEWRMAMRNDKIGEDFPGV